MTGQMLTYLLVICLISSARGRTAKSIVESYPCPKECQCFQRKGGTTLVDVVCNLQKLNEYSNFSVIQTNVPSILYVVCNTRSVTKLRDFIFKDLQSFIGISFTNCRFNHVPRYTFHGMKSLRHISIDNARNLTFDEDVFSDEYRITHLTVVNSDVIRLPDMCALKFLQFVNVTGNQIANFSDVGLNCNSDSHLLALKTVILSKNLFTYLDKNFGSVAPNIWELDINNCNIRNVEQDVFLDLSKLGWLDMSNNQLENLPTDLLVNNDKLILLAIGDNPLMELPKGFFDRVTKLAVLGLSNTGIDDHIWDVLTSLWKIRELQLSGNNLTRIDRTIMYQHTELEYLDLRDNSISSINADIFSKLSYLRTLLLGHNNISDISVAAFNGLFNLTKLDLRYNNISELSQQTFSSLLSLGHLNLSYNLLSEIPVVSQSLIAMDLRHNSIENITRASVGGLKLMKALYISDNQIAKIPKNVFEKMTNLIGLDFSRNRIMEVEEGAFRGLDNLLWLYLSNNNIRDIQNIFNNIRNLTILDLSKNLLNISLYDGLFPSSLEVLSLEFNEITQVHMYAFYKCEFLRKIDLRFNKISTLSSTSLTTSASSSTAIYLSGNPFNCDCNLKWLRELLERPSSGNPYIKDLEELTCKSGFRLKPFSRLTSIRPRDMLCTYQEKCNRITCMCCTFDPCICKYKCPQGCGCFHALDMSDDHIIVCSSKNLTSVPSPFPSSATELYMDGNMLDRLGQHTFFGMLSVKVIYLNHSGIQLLENRTFSGTSGLQKLYLDNNMLTEVRNGVFDSLVNLTELHLEHNMLSFIEENVFDKLIHLKKLYLNNNNLREIPSSLITKGAFLQTITLSSNLWTCSCSFMETFYAFILTISAVRDKLEARCYMNSTVTISMSSETNTFKENYPLPVLDFNMRYLCPNVNLSYLSNSNQTSLEGPLTQSTYSWNKNPYIVVIVASLAIITVLCIIGFIYRHLLQVYVFSKCGMRLNCVGSEGGGNLYDAFISYSIKDTDFVERQLVTKLEGDGNDFKLCLFHRDLNSSVPMSEAVFNAVSESKRVIIVLSKSFIDNEWRNHDIHFAHHQVIVGKQSKLIFVVLQNVDNRTLNKIRKLYRKTDAYFRYGDPWFWDKLMFTMPEISVRSHEDVRQNMLVNTTDLGPITVGSSVDDEGYETPVSRSASRQENEKFSSLESFSLRSVNNIYEEIGTPVKPICDV